MTGKKLWVVGLILASVVTAALTCINHIKASNIALMSGRVAMARNTKMTQSLIDDEAIPAGIRDTLRAITKDRANAVALHQFAASKARSALHFANGVTLVLLFSTGVLAIGVGGLLFTRPKPPPVMNDARRFRLMREELFLTQRQLADFLPVSQTTTQRFEAGLAKVGKAVWIEMVRLNPKSKWVIEWLWAADQMAHLWDESVLLPETT